jgi:hypothetical protein
VVWMKRMFYFIYSLATYLGLSACQALGY